MNLSLLVIRLTGIKRGELTLSLLFFLCSFCTGLFVAFHFTTATSVFLKEFSASDIPLTYLISGLMGVLILNGYSDLQKKISLKTLHITTLVLLLLVMVGFNILALNHSNPAIRHWLAYALYIWIGPPVALLQLITTGLFLQSFDLRQGKRLYALLNSGEIVASVLGYVFLPVILKAIGGDPYDLLYFADGGLLACATLVPLIFKNSKISLQTPKKPAATQKRKLNFDFLKDPFTRLISAVGMLSMIAVYFADFGFLGGTKIVAEGGKAPVQFIALFYALVKTSELLMSFFSGGLLNQFGIKMGLTILPMLMTGCMVLGTLAGFGVDEAVGIFVFLAFNRFLDRVVRKGLDNPSFRILFQPLPAEIRTQTQTVVDGIFKQAAIAIAGISLMIFTAIFSKADKSAMTWFALMNTCALGAWAYFALKAYDAYRNKLRQAALGNRTPENTRIQTGLLLAAADAQTKPEGMGTRILRQILPRPNGVSIPETDYDRLSTLLKDPQPAVRMASLRVAAELRDTKLSPRLLDLLQSPMYGYMASETLTSYGDSLLNELEVLFSKTKSQVVQKHIVELYARINSEATRRLLLEKLRYTNRDIQATATYALVRLGFRAEEDYARLLIKQKIAELSNIILWADAALLDLGQGSSLKPLIDAIEAQQQEDFDMLFMLLGFIYGESTIQLIRDTLLNSGKEGNVYALEMMDNFLGEDMKKPLMALCENSPATTKLKKLQDIYPQQRLEPIDRLRDIINKDYVRVNIWIKVQALFLLGKFTRGKSLPTEILACTYHPHPLMREAALLLVGNPPANGLLYDRINLLRRSALFDKTPEYKLVPLASQLAFQQYFEGETIACNKYEEAYFLISGSAEVQSATGEQVALQIGELFLPGVHCAFAPATLWAHTDCRLLIGRKAEVLEQLLADAELAEPMLVHVEVEHIAPDQQHTI